MRSRLSAIPLEVEKGGDSDSEKFRVLLESVCSEMLWMLSSNGISVGIESFGSIELSDTDI